MTAPKHIEVERERGVGITWADGRRDFFPAAYLRRMSPSAEARTLREELARNPLAVVPGGGGGPVRILEAGLRGNYALWVRFSDGHETGIYSWEYLKELSAGLETGGGGR